MRKSSPPLMLTEVSEPVRVLGAIAVSFLVTAGVTPSVRRLAIRTSFYDEPTGYKQHDAPTPYLGGTALMAGFLAAVALMGTGLSDFETLLAGALALWAVGTIDDRIRLGITPRLAVQLGAAVFLWAEGIGWGLFASDAANLVLSVFWTVGLINAFNLMDNLDGAAGTVGATCALGAGALALAQNNTPLAVLAFALAGACAGFLPWNLANPARIFLGDGGSMPLGFLVAGIVMAIPDGSVGWVALFALAPMAGLPILDTTLVVVSRLRRRVPVLSGGRDHLTHRLLALFGTPRRVAAVLAGTQALFCGLGILLEEVRDPDVVLPFAIVYVLAGLAIVFVLEFTPAMRAREPGWTGEPAAEHAGWAASGVGGPG